MCAYPRAALRPVPRFVIDPIAIPSPQKSVVGYPVAADWAALELRGPWQRSLRHEAEPRDWRSVGLGVAVAVLLTVVAVVAFNQGMQRKPDLRSYRDTIQVNLIDPTPPLALQEPPPPEPAPFQRRQSVVRIDTPKTIKTPPAKTPPPESSNEMTGRLGEAGSTTTLFNADGRVRLPSSAGGTGTPAAVAATEQQQARRNWESLQKRGENPLDCQRTRFAQAFRTDQSAGDAVAGKYLKWIGLANQAAIAKRAGDREARAADGCEPAR